MSTPKAHALKLELGAGFRQYQAAPSGVWYQKGVGGAYTLDLAGSVWSAGVSGTVRPWLRYGLRYIRLGGAYSNSLDTPVDANYDGAEHRCFGKCLPLARYVGHGSVQGIAATLQSQLEIAPRLYSFVEAGPMLYRPTWRMDVYGWRKDGTGTVQNLHIVHRAHWQLGYVYGLGMRYRKTSIAFDIYDTRTLGDGWPAAYMGAYTLMIREEF